MIRTRAALLLTTALVATGCEGCQEGVPEGTPETRQSSDPPLPKRRQDRKAGLRAQIADARASEGKSYVGPTETEVAEFRSWIRGVVGAGLAGDLPRHSPPAGFAGWIADRGRLWVLGEQSDHKRGAGLCVVRPGKGRRLLIEAPHTFFDLGTLELALLAFEKLEARALLINTMHRSGREGADERASDARSGESPSDVAHAEHSFFSAAHTELIGIEPGLVSVQLHGFRDDRLPGAEVVVSAAETNGDAAAVAAALRRVLTPTGVKLYPVDAQVLGGTRNRQAALSLASKSPFIHLEISGSVRERLNGDAQLAERFVEALGAARGAERP